MLDDHVAKRAGGFVKRGALAQAQRFRHVDLHMIDEVAIPDRLEQTVGEPERENVLGRLLAEEMIDAENLIFRKYLVQFGIEPLGAGEVDAERFFHDDARVGDQIGLLQQAHCRQGGLGRHAQIVNAPALAAQRLFGLFHCLFQRVGAGRQRQVIENLSKCRPVILAHLARGELVQRLVRELAKSVGIEIV